MTIAAYLFAYVWKHGKTVRLIHFFTQNSTAAILHTGDLDELDSVLKERNAISWGRLHILETILANIFD